MKVILFLLSILISSASYCYAQYDDDIYYVPKPKKETTRTDYSNRTSQDRTTYTSSPADINDMDVDAYNRRGDYSGVQSDTSKVSTEDESDFAYTDRIKRFHNPTVVIEANDPDLYDLYYLNPSSVNIVIGNTWGGWGPSWGSWNFGWSYPWYRPSYWNSWYNPWYGWNDPFWGPSWGWNDPWWGHHHYHPVGPPVYYGNNGYYSGNGRRPNGVVNPGNPGRPSDTPGRRPGYTNGTGGRRPSSTTGTNPSGTVNRPSNSGQSTGGYRGTPGSNYNHSGGSSSTPSRNNNSTIGRRPGSNSSGESNYRGSGSNNNNSNFSAPSRGSSGSSFGGYRGGGSSGGGGGGRGGRR